MNVIVLINVCGSYMYMYASLMMKGPKEMHD